MYDPKREYLIKTFSRTKRKDYENYILNAIWHKLDRSDIQPVSQQYIKRSDGSYALVDLFFPQINIGIECDEAYHIDNKEKDHNREITMEQMLSAYDQTMATYKQIQQYVKNKYGYLPKTCWIAHMKELSGLLFLPRINVPELLKLRDRFQVC